MPMHNDASADMQFNLHNAEEKLLRGLGCEQRGDYLEAVQLYNEAKNLGSIRAIVFEAKSYYYGLGVPQDYKKASALYQQFLKQAPCEDNLIKLLDSSYEMNLSMFSYSSRSLAFGSYDQTAPLTPGLKIEWYYQRILKDRQLDTLPKRTNMLNGLLSLDPIVETRTELLLQLAQEIQSHRLHLCLLKNFLANLRPQIPLCSPFYHAPPSLAFVVHLLISELEKGQSLKTLMAQTHLLFAVEQFPRLWNFIDSFCKLPKNAPSNLYNSNAVTPQWAP